MIVVVNFIGGVRIRRLTIDWNDNIYTILSSLSNGTRLRIHYGGLQYYRQVQDTSVIRSSGTPTYVEVETVR